MSEMPAYVTRTQIIAATEALGLDPRDVTHFQADATDGVIVVVRARNTEGKLAAAGGHAVHMAHHIPIGHGPNGDQW